MAQLWRCTTALSGAPSVAAHFALAPRPRTVPRVTCQAPRLERVPAPGAFPWRASAAGGVAAVPFVAAPALAEEVAALSASAEVELPALEAPAGESLEAAVEVPADVSVPALETELATVDEGTFLLLAGAALAALLIGLVSVVLSRGYAGDVPPPVALSAVESGQAILLDVRSGKEKREDGSPRVKASSRGQTTLVAVPFLKSLGGDEFEVDDGFVEAVLGSRAMDLNGSIIVVDSSGAKEIGIAAAKALTAAGVNNVAVLKGGSDAWKDQGLPWNDPLLSLPSLNEGSIREGLQSAASTLSEVAEETQKALPGALTVLAAAGATVAFVAEAEVIIQLAASLAAGQFFVSRLLFAKDREQTLAQLKALIGPPEAPAKEASSAPSATEAAAASNGAAATAGSSPREAAPSAPAAAAAVTEAPPAPEAPTASTDLPPASWPLSPYPTYPDLKPPSSPSPLPPVAPSAAATTGPPPSTDLPKAERPLSPYAAYPDLKPPSSPTPLPPSSQQEAAALTPTPPAAPITPNPSP